MLKHLNKPSVWRLKGVKFGGVQCAGGAHHRALSLPSLSDIISLHQGGTVPIKEATLQAIKSSTSIESLVAAVRTSGAVRGSSEVLLALVAKYSSLCATSIGAPPSRALRRLKSSIATLTADSMLSLFDVATVLR